MSTNPINVLLLLVDDFSTADHSSFDDHSFMSSGLGGSLVFRLSCNTTREERAKILQIIDGKLMLEK